MSRRSRHASHSHLRAVVRASPFAFDDVDFFSCPMFAFALLLASSFPAADYQMLTAYPPH